MSWWEKNIEWKVAFFSVLGTLVLVGACFLIYVQRVGEKEAKKEAYQTYEMKRMANDLLTEAQLINGIVQVEKAHSTIFNMILGPPQRTLALYP